MKAYVGDLDPEEVSHRWEEIASRLAEVGVEIERKRGLVEPLQGELAKAEKALADSRIASAKNGWLEDLYVQHVAADTFQKRLREAARAGEALEGARRKAAESGALSEARCRDAGEEPDDLPEIADEPAWNEGLEGLRALLEGGPLRPVAKHKAALATSQAQWQRQRRERIAWALKQGLARSTSFVLTSARRPSGAGLPSARRTRPRKRRGGQSNEPARPGRG